MEDALVQSAMAEIAMWDAFAAGRTANATGFLAIVLAVWVAARFSSVSLEKNVNMLGKVFVTAFAVGVFLDILATHSENLPPRHFGELGVWPLSMILGRHQNFDICLKLLPIGPP